MIERPSAWRAYSASRLGIAREPGLVADGLDDRAEVADRDALAEQRLEHTLDLAERQDVGDDLVDDRLVGGLQLVEQLPDVLAREQLTPAWVRIVSVRWVTITDSLSTTV